MMNVGVIGIGGYAAKILDCLDKRSSFQVVYGYHPDPVKAKRWDPKRGTARLKDILSSQEIEAVFILTPTQHHFKYCVQAIKAGKHVFVEKPLTHKLSDARTIGKLLKGRSLRFFVGHNFRRQPWCREIKKIIESGRLGKIVSLVINKSHGGIYNLPANNWRADVQSHPEGPLATVGIHYFDLLHYWFGPVTAVNAVLKNVAGLGTAPDANAVMLMLKTGATVYLQTNYCQCLEDFIHIYGTDGTVYCQNHRLVVRHGRDVGRIPSPSKEIKLADDRSIDEQIKEFYKSIKSGKSIETGFKEGLNSLCVLDACGKSSNAGRWVKLDTYPDYFSGKK